jgi:hypothetical protein
VDLVLGLSVTSAAVRMVLVEGASAEGATIDHDAFGMTAVGQGAAANASEHAVDAVLGTESSVAAGGHHLRSIGVTWTDDAEDEASMVLETLASEGIHDVVAVPGFKAAEALAVGLAGANGYDEVALCVVEPEMTLLSMIKTHDGAVVDRLARIAASADPLALIAILDSPGWDPQRVYLVGSSSDLARVAWELDGAVSPPVVSAAEADLALARGAALASAWGRYDDGGAWATPEEEGVPAVDPRIARVAAMDDSDEAAKAPAKVRALTSVLVAAVLTFVVSLAVALGLRLTPDHASQTAAAAQVANAAPQPQLLPSAPQHVPSAPQHVPSAPQRVPSVAVQAPPAPQQLPPAPPPEARPPVQAPAVPESVPDAQSIAAAPAPAQAPQWAPPIEQPADPPAAAPVAPPAAPPPAVLPPGQNTINDSPPKHPWLSKIPLIRRLPGVEGPADPAPPPDQGPAPLPPDAPPPPP